MPVALSNLQLTSPALASSQQVGGMQLGTSVHFEIAPAQAVFDGTLGDEAIEGTFRDEQGRGSFRLEKQPDMTDEVTYTP